jgi:hypothetical protein
VLESSVMDDGDLVGFEVALNVGKFFMFTWRC